MAEEEAKKEDDAEEVVEAEEVLAAGLGNARPGELVCWAAAKSLDARLSAGAAAAGDPTTSGLDEALRVAPVGEEGDGDEGDASGDGAARWRGAEVALAEGRDTSLPPVMEETPGPRPNNLGRTVVSPVFILLLRDSSRATGARAAFKGEGEDEEEENAAAAAAEEEEEVVPEVDEDTRADGTAREGAAGTGDA